MAKPRRPTATSPEGVTLTDDVMAEGYLLPDESPEAYHQLVTETLEEFAPRTPYQRRLALNLAQIEWELVRHRRLLAAAVRTGFREQASMTERHGTPGTAARPFDVTNVRTELGDGLLSDDPEIRRQSDQYLIGKQVTRSEIAAAAYYFAANQVSWHEGRISDLERRRRSLTSDLKALRDSKGPTSPIIDAEIL